MLNRYARAGLTRILTPVARLLARLGVSPDAVTVTGSLLVVLAALVLYPLGQLFWGSLAVAAFVFADSLDGILARTTGRTSVWGAFLDSTLDRLGDAAVFGGLMIWYFTGGANPLVAVLCFACLALGFTVSYAKARAEGLGLECEVGIAGRSDRLVVVLTAAGLTGLGWFPTPVLAAALVLLAVSSAVTIVQRMTVVRRQLRVREATGSPAEDAPAATSPGDGAPDGAAPGGEERRLRRRIGAA